VVRSATDDNQPYLYLIELESGATKVFAPVTIAEGVALSPFSRIHISEPQEASNTGEP
jgi:hypothetical protein